MAKKKKDVNDDGEDRGIPEDLISLMDRAKENAFPDRDEQDTATLPELVKVMTPVMVSDPRYKGNGTPTKVCREPLFMFNWDKSTGAWRWTISDKVLGFSLVGTAERLTGLLEAANASIIAGRVAYKPTRLT